MKLKYFTLTSLLVLGACSHFEKPLVENKMADNKIAPYFPNLPDAKYIAASGVKWREFYKNQNLIFAIDYGLKQNKDLKIAAINTQKAQNTLELAKIARKPSLRGVASSDLSGKSGDILTDTYTFGASVPSYEIDFFDRLKSLQKASEENFYSALENQKAIKIAYITTLANAWVNIASDMTQIEILKSNIASLQETAKIVKGRQKYGVANDLDANSVEAQLNELIASLKATQTKLENDKSTLVFLAGGQGVLEFLPNGLKSDFTIAEVAIGLPSDVLLARPDIMAAEHALSGANANLTAARAQKFPSINLTASFGFASNELLNLLAGPRFLITPSISAPIFDNGASDINIDNARLNRDALIHQYEKAINSAFNDVSQALNTRAQIEARIKDQSAAVENYRKSVFLAKRRFEVGIDNYLPLLLAQRNLNNAQATLLNLQTLRANNLIGLYSALSNDDDF
ncbi:MAG: TolC family protein [Caulobacterales bacterium]|nr:TolC family protein [Caulobacterales bacterium]MCA0373522.1 TolC family protein [Pseudomonadota bacterium]